MADRPASKRRRAVPDERRRTLLDSLPRTPATPRANPPAGRSGSYPADRAHPDETIETPGRLTLPSMPRMSAARRKRPARPAPAAQPRSDWDDTGAYVDAARTDDAYGQRGYQRDAYDPYEAPAYADDTRGYDDGAYAEYGAASYEDYGAYGEDGDRDGAGWSYATRSRERSLARPLTPALPQYNDPLDAPVLVYPPLSIASAPELAAYRPARAPRRMRLDTRALARSARNPWTITRLALALIAMLLALAHAPGQMGEQAQPLMNAQARVGLAPGGATTTLVRPETQLLRPDLYDNYAQFLEWGGAACSAAAISEVLTAYGVPHATIGHEIDELGAYISPNGGLLNRHGFAVVAAKHNLRADESTSLTYNQILYLTEQLGMPVIVNVHISYGYYHFFDGGHFLTVVGGDAQGLKIVDSSEYYIQYLPKDVFYQMFTGYTAAIVPVDYQYTLPND